MPEHNEANFSIPKFLFEVQYFGTAALWSPLTVSSRTALPTTGESSIQAKQNLVQDHNMRAG
jgi:hypothetical protein